MGILSFFKSETAVEKAADAAVKGLDAIWHTAEEKEQDAQTRLDYYLKILELTKSASPARRLIAMIVLTLWLITGLVWLAIIVYSLTLADAQAIKSTLELLKAFSVEYVATPSSWVLGFYFAAHVLKPFKKE